MSSPLTLTSATFNASGKFGQSLNGGYGQVANPFPSNGTFTLSAWVKTTSNGAVQVAAGANGTAWVGVNGSTATAHYGFGSSVEVTLNGPSIADGAWHLLELDVSASGGKFFVDGALAANSSTTFAAASGITSNNFGIRAFIGYVGSFDWQGEVDEVAIYSTAQNSTAYTPPTSATSNAASGLVALWHLDGDGTDSAGAAAGDTTAPSMVGSLSSSNITSGGYTLSWSAGTDNVGVTGYEYSTDNGATWADAGNVLSKAITGRTANTLYHNQVRAYDAAGNRSTSIALDVTTASASDTVAPTMNGTLVASAPATSGYTLTWQAASDNVGVSGYEYSDNGGTTWTDVGNVLTTPVTGRTAGTLYTPQLRAYDVAGNRATAISTTVTTASSVNNALTNGTGNVLFSPYNWNVQASTAKTINAGAYFKTKLSGTSCMLNFDMTGIASPVPEISYMVDGTGTWTTVNIAASVVIAMPSGTSDYASKGGHVLEVFVKSTTETQARWATQATAVSLTGIVLDNGATLSKPPALPMNGLYYGDSITEGVRTLNATATNDTDRNDAKQGWAFQSARMLGAEAGIVGFGATGLTVPGSGSVPALPTSYNQLYNGVARTFSPEPDFIVLNEGTNDGSNDVTSAATTVLNGLLAATPSSTKIIVLRPFNGNRDSQLVAAISACSTPSRVTHVDTTGWFNTANSADGLHPYGNENITHIAPLAAAAIKSALSSATATASRTFSAQLYTDATTPAANLANLKVRCYNVDGTLAGSTDTGTSDASGNVSLTAQSTAAAGASCLMTVRDGSHHWSNFVTVT